MSKEKQIEVCMYVNAKAVEYAKTEIMRTAANSYKMHYENLARELFEEIEKHLVFNAYGIAVISDKTFEEIKNKYMGVRNDR